MRTTSTTVTRAALTAVVLVLVLALAGCGDGAPRPEATAGPTVPPTAARPSSPIDDVVTVGGGDMHIRCRGEGATTVLLLAGWGGGMEGWGAVEPAVAERARVCAYSRFGTGASDPPPRTQTFATQATDLHRLLRAVGESGPYVLVGHSFGGAQAVTFASRYADEVAGLLLVDASPVSWPAAVCAVPAYAPGCAVMRDPALDAERLDVFPAFAEVAAIESLGELPMTVLTAAHRTGPQLDAGELAALDEIWADGVERWASLSTSSDIVPIESGHDIHVEHPQVVVHELLQLLP